MTDEELSISDVTLIARLRNTPNWMREGFQNWKDNVRTYDTAPFEAADRIEQLVATNEALTAERDDFADQISELLPSVNREAVEQRQRADAAEAKLAKAEAGLLAIAKRDEQMIWGEDYEVEEAFKDMRDIACATIAEIKGESHD